MWRPKCGENYMKTRQHDKNMTASNHTLYIFNLLYASDLFLCNWLGHFLSNTTISTWRMHPIYLLFTSFHQLVYFGSSVHAYGSISELSVFTKVFFLPLFIHVFWMCWIRQTAFIMYTSSIDNKYTTHISVYLHTVCEKLGKIAINLTQLCFYRKLSINFH